MELDNTYRLHAIRCETCNKPAKSTTCIKSINLNVMHMATPGYVYPKKACLKKDLIFTTIRENYSQVLQQSNDLPLVNFANN